MNLNEHCLLNFLVNPDEIKELSEFFKEKNDKIKASEDNSKLENIVKISNFEFAK